jgi:hypothetical protein
MYTVKEDNKESKVVIITKDIKVEDLRVGQTVIQDDIDITLSNSNLKNIDFFMGTRWVGSKCLKKNNIVQIRLYKHYVNSKFVANVDMR